MKLSQALPTVLALAATAPFGAADPIMTCDTQSKCLDFKITEQPSSKCIDHDCEYEICVKTYFDKPGCVKGGSETLHHICKKNSQICLDNGGLGRGFPVGNIPTFWKQCQYVSPGGKAEFLFKDGMGCDTGDAPTAHIALDSGVVASCAPRPHSVSTCNGEAVGEQCYWSLYAPSECPTYGGMMGDPHIMRWNGKRFSYHGECDLMMLKSEEFGDGKGLNLHIRTTIEKFYSFVDSMALQIGEDVLEISSTQVYFNGQEQQDLPAYISGYPITVEQDDNKMIRIDLHNGDRIEVKIYKQFVSVNVAARKADFGNSAGLLGDFHTGAMLARDGKTVIELDDEFGAEWQVQADEPKLFHNNRSPQLPEETCRMPAISAARGLRQDADLKQAAEEACSHKPADAIDFCVFDVMATGDLGMAGAW